MEVTINVINKATKIDWENKTDAFSLSFLPRVFEISAVVPAELPTLTAIIIS